MGVMKTSVFPRCNDSLGFILNNEGDGSNVDRLPDLRIAPLVHEADRAKATHAAVGLRDM